MDIDRKVILNKINKYIPQNIDWKKGAKTYLKELIASGGESYKRWHYTKPFICEPLCGKPLHGDKNSFGVDKYITYDELYLLLNVLRKIDLPERSKVIDVGCGPGWVSQILGKMGYSVMGFDICRDMISIAKKRLKSEKYPPYPLKTLDVRFIVHDIEDKCLDIEELYDCAIFESTLHHFLDPVSAIKNISKNLKDNAVIIITEGRLQQENMLGVKNDEIMKRYKTLERTFTKDQLKEILEHCGFSNYVFFNMINGLIVDDELDNGRTKELKKLTNESLNIVLASKNTSSMQIILPDKFDSDSRYIKLTRFYDEEKNEENMFRWSKNYSRINLRNYSHLRLTISSFYPKITKKSQTIFILLNGVKYREISLTDDMSSVDVEFTDLSSDCLIEFYSDSVFFPKLYKINEDMRCLSFMVEIIELS